jgi:hypothetical protein
LPRVGLYAVFLIGPGKNPGYIDEGKIGVLLAVANEMKPGALIQAFDVKAAGHDTR